MVLRKIRFKRNGKKDNIFYKLAREDGWDFYTGKTINYRENIGKVVKCPNPNPSLGICSAGVIHASKNPLDCFVGASIPCSAYKVRGEPVCGDEKKSGFVEFEVLEEIHDLDSLFGFKYSEVMNPINPLALQKRKPGKEDFENLKTWISAGDSVRAAVATSVWDSVWGSVWEFAWNSVLSAVVGSVWSSVWNSVRYPVWDSARDAMWAYLGSLFPSLKDDEGEYPFQSAVNLWRRGFVPSFDGNTWRLHSGEKAEIVWEGTIEDLDKELGK